MPEEIPRHDRQHDWRSYQQERKPMHNIFVLLVRTPPLEEETTFDTALIFNSFFILKL